MRRRAGSSDGHDDGAAAAAAAAAAGAFDAREGRLIAGALHELGQINCSSESPLEPDLLARPGLEVGWLTNPRFFR
jgi:hypothetical protein